MQVIAVNEMRLLHNRSADTVEEYTLNPKPTETFHLDARVDEGPLAAPLHANDMRGGLSCCSDDGRGHRLLWLLLLIAGPGASASACAGHRHQAAGGSAMP